MDRSNALVSFGEYLILNILEMGLLLRINLDVTTTNWGPPFLECSISPDSAVLFESQRSAALTNKRLKQIISSSRFISVLLFNFLGFEWKDHRTTLGIFHCHVSFLERLIVVILENSLVTSPGLFLQISWLRLFLSQVASSCKIFHCGQCLSHFSTKKWIHINSTQLHISLFLLSQVGPFGLLSRSYLLYSSCRT